MNSGNAKVNDQVLDVARTMAIHSAAMKPGYLNKEDVDEKTINDTLEEAEVAAQKNLKEGMPDHVAQKVIDGVKNKALSQMHKRDVLMEQDLATSEEKQLIKDYLKAQQKELGTSKLDIDEWVLFAIR